VSRYGKVKRAASRLSQPKQAFIAQYEEFSMQLPSNHNHQAEVIPVVQPVPVVSGTPAMASPLPQLRPVAFQRPQPRRSNGLLLALILTGIAGAVVVVVGAVLLLIFVALPRLTYGTEIPLSNGSQLFYTSAVSEAEAQKLAQHLETTMLKDNRFKGSIQLNRSGNTYQIRFVVKEGAESNDLAVLAFQVYGQMASKEVFNGAPVEVHFCDQSLHTVRVLPPLGK
jgi:hypothetical protein